VDTYEEFKEKIEQGYVLAHWDNSVETAERIQAETKATIRCIPLDAPKEEGVDMLTGKKSERRVIFAKSY
jgi:prolyl-tRNA synthetase